MKLGRRSVRVSGAPANVDALWELAPVGAFECDLDGGCRSVNPRWCELAGLHADDAIGQGWQRVVHPADLQPFLDTLRAHVEGGDRFETNFRFVRPDLKTVAVHAIVRIIRDDAGKAVGVLGLLADVSHARVAEAERAETERALRSSEEMHRRLATHMPVGVAHRDRDGNLLFLNPAFREILGVAADYPVAAVTFDVLHPDDRDRVATVVEQAWSTRSSYEYEARILQPSGAVRWIALRGAHHVGDDGEFDGHLITGVDVTAQREAQQAMRQSDEQFRIAFERAPIGIGMIGMDGRFERVNEAFMDIVGYTSEEMCDLPPYTIVSPDDKAEARTRLLELLHVDQETASMEFRMVHKSGRQIWAEARINLIRHADGSPSRFLMQVQDVSDRKNYEQRLKHMAHHDALTGLVNRRGLERELDLQIARVRRYGTRGCLMMLDLDGFKHVNDGLGHAVGDAMLVGVAGALVERLRETDVVARLGGDEFAVILPAESPAQSRIVAAALVEAVAAACVPFHTDKPVTVSLGIVSFDDQMSADEALIHADHAMYAAKQAGKNRFAMHDPASGVPVLSQPALHPLA